MIRFSQAVSSCVQVFYEVTDQYMSVLKVRQAVRTAACMHSTLSTVKNHHLLSVSQQYCKSFKAPLGDLHLLLRPQRRQQIVKKI